MQSSGEVSTLAGSKGGFADGKGHAAKCNGPEGIYYNSSDQSLVVCDWLNSRLRRVQLNGMWSNPLSSWFFFPCFSIWCWNAGDVTTLCELADPFTAVLTANKTLIVSTASHQIHKVTQKGIHIALIVMMSHAHTSLQALIAMMSLYWQDLEIEGEWMEGLTSANSIFQEEWQWMNRVTLASLLIWGAIQSEGSHSKTDERCCWSTCPPLLLYPICILHPINAYPTLSCTLVQYNARREE